MVSAAFVFTVPAVALLSILMKTVKSTGWNRTLMHLRAKFCVPLQAVQKRSFIRKAGLRHPLKRVGPKGTYEFEKISWEEAFDIIVNKLNLLKDAYGPETVGFYSGTGAYERALKDIYQLKGSELYLSSSILFPFGSPNTFGVGAPCYTSLGVLAPKLTMGCRHIDMFSDVDNSDLIIVWGTDPSTSTPPEMFQRLKRAREEGRGNYRHRSP